jgi:hypothetical protein
MFYGSVAFFGQFIDHFLGFPDYPAEPVPEDGTVLHQIVMARSTRNRILAQSRIDQQKILNRFPSVLSKVKRWLLK